MLVFRRSIGQTVELGDEIVVKINEISGDKVLLGVTAPPKMKILRQELVTRGETTDRQPTPLTRDRRHPYRRSRESGPSRRSRKMASSEGVVGSSSK